MSSQALSQSHPSGIQPHTQLQLPEWLSRPAASLLTEVRSAGPTEAAPWPEGGRWEGRTLCVNQHAATGRLMWVREVTKFPICWWPNTTSVPQGDTGFCGLGWQGVSPQGHGDKSLEVSPHVSNGAGEACQGLTGHFSTATAVRCQQAPGNWRGRCQQTQVPPLFQYHPVEQAGGVREGGVGNGSSWTGLSLLSSLRPSVILSL